MQIANCAVQVQRKQEPGEQEAGGQDAVRPGAGVLHLLEKVSCKAYILLIRIKPSRPSHVPLFVPPNER